MNERGIKKQIRDVYALLNTCQDNDEVVLVENGVETSNTYPKWNLYEPDTKSPEMWVRGIHLHNTLNGRNVSVSFKIK